MVWHQQWTRVAPSLVSISTQVSGTGTVWPIYRSEPSSKGCHVSNQGYVPPTFGRRSEPLDGGLFEKPPPGRLRTWELLRRPIAPPNFELKNWKDPPFDAHQQILTEVTEISETTPFCEISMQAELLQLTAFKWVLLHKLQALTFGRLGVVSPTVFVIVLCF